MSLILKSNFVDGRLENRLTLNGPGKYIADVAFDKYPRKIKVNTIPNEPSNFWEQVQFIVVEKWDMSKKEVTFHSSRHNFTMLEY